MVRSQDLIFIANYQLALIHRQRWQNLFKQQTYRDYLKLPSPFVTYQRSATSDIFDFIQKILDGCFPVRVTVDDTWRRFCGDGLGFLSTVPDLSNTPPTDVVSPVGSENGSRGIASEECIIISVNQVKSLHSLCDAVLISRRQTFNWPPRCIERDSIIINSDD